MYICPDGWETYAGLERWERAVLREGEVNEDDIDEAHELI